MSGILKVIEYGKSSEIYNIGSGIYFNNNELALKLLEMFDLDSSSIKYVKDRPGHDFRYSLDSSKIRKELNWAPKVSFEEGLKTTVEWYLKNQEWWKDIADIKTLLLCGDSQRSYKLVDCF